MCFDKKKVGFLFILLLFLGYFFIFYVNFGDCGFATSLIADGFFVENG
jgi:hypothetical protein